MVGTAPRSAADPAAEPMVAACAGAEDPWARLEACDAAILSGRWPGAAGAWAYTNRAVARGLLGQHLEAFEDHDRAVTLNPDLPQALNNRANARADFREWDRALADLDRAILLAPDYLAAHYNRAGVLLAMGRAAEAAAAYDRVLSLDPGFLAALVDRAAALCQAGDAAGAAADLRAAALAGAADPAALAATLAAKGYLARDADASSATGPALDAWTHAGCP